MAGRLTAIDLSHVPVKDCDCIDSWLDALDEHTDFRVSLSSGTTGTASFVPRTLQETDIWLENWRVGTLGAVGLNARDNPDVFFDVVWLNFKYGYGTQMRMVPAQINISRGPRTGFTR